MALGTITPPPSRVIARTVAPVSPRTFKLGECSPNRGAVGVEVHGHQRTEPRQRLVDAVEGFGFRRGHAFTRLPGDRLENDFGARADVPLEVGGAAPERDPERGERQDQHDGGGNARQERLGECDEGRADRA